MIWTDPPYGVSYGEKTKWNNRHSGGASRRPIENDAQKPGELQSPESIRSGKTRGNLCQYSDHGETGQVASLAGTAHSFSRSTRKFQPRTGLPCHPCCERRKVSLLCGRPSEAGAHRNIQLDEGALWRYPESMSPGAVYAATITMIGWGRLGATGVNSRIAFVAMSFDPGLNSVFYRRYRAGHQRCRLRAAPHR